MSPCVWSRRPSWGPPRLRMLAQLERQILNACLSGKRPIVMVKAEVASAYKNYVFYEFQAYVLQLIEQGLLASSYAEWNHPRPGTLMEHLETTQAGRWVLNHQERLNDDQRRHVAIELALTVLLFAAIFEIIHLSWPLLGRS